MTDNSLPEERKPRYRCIYCEFLCYSEVQEKYHRDRACLEMRRLISVMSARKRSGHKNHIELRVGNAVIKKITLLKPAIVYKCTCRISPTDCQIHSQTNDLEEGE